MAFSESKQSENEAGGMVSLYATRVQDLGEGEVAMLKYGACGHATLIPPNGLVHGLCTARGF